MLFGALNSNIFMLFSGENRYLYEEVIGQIYSTCFGADLLFPTQNELVGIVYELLAARPALWHDEGPLLRLDEISARGRRLRRRQRPDTDTEATGDAMARARHIYGRLIETGWLSESRYGLRVTVDMPPGAMRLAEFLTLLRGGESEQLGGLIIEVKNALEAVRLSAKNNALGLHKASQDAVSFGRYLRSVLASLREIDRQLIESHSLQERLQRYFEDFVERLLLKDYASITTTAHPYRFRHLIFDTVQQIENSAVDIESIGMAYASAHLAPDAAAARDLVFDDLDTIRRVFQRIDEAFQRIEQHRLQLEVRLRNTVRYAGRKAEAYLRRSEEAVLGLDKLLEKFSGGRHELTVSGSLEFVRHPYAAALLARPRGERPPVSAEALALPESDPLRDLRRELERAYLERLTVTPKQVLSFLRRRILPLAAVEARYLPINTLDDFLAFETLRTALRGVAHGETDGQLARGLSAEFEFDLSAADLVDNDWLTCSNFKVRRKAEPAWEAGFAP